MLGLIGDPVRRSPSPTMHQAAFAAMGLDWRYSAIEVAAGALPQMWSELQSSLLGVNVTTPHKEVAAALVQRLTPEARAAGSVNTVVFHAEGAVGATTDGTGFMRALEEAGMRSPTRSLILGAGGAARAVGAALVAAGCSVTLAARNREQAAAVAARLATEQVAVSAIQLHPRPILEILEGCDLLVNATTVGANPGPGECPLPAEVDLHPGVLVFDLVYGAAPTELLRRAGRAGCRTVPGVEMLVHQAAQSLEIWSGRPAPIEVMREAAREFLRRPREDA